MTEPDARLVAMTPDAVSAWRADRLAAGAPLPDADETPLLEAFDIVVDEIAVGGALLSFEAGGGGPRATIRLLQTTVADDAGREWAAILAALESLVRRRGARTLVTAVPARLAARFGDAGFRATMTGVGVSKDPAAPRAIDDTGRVRVRPMTDAERRRFAAEAGASVRADMERSGVLSPGEPMVEVEQRLAGLVDGPPAGELLLTATVDGVPVGRFWGTLTLRADGAEDLTGNLIDLFPEHRGQGLTRAFMAALESQVLDRGVRGVRGNVYGHDERARTTLTGIGVGIDDVHLRKDLV